jgi:hypothetical protein
MRLSVLAVVAAAATVAVVGVTTIGSTQPGGRTITVIERDRAEKESYVDNPPRGTARHARLSAGDLFTLRGPVFDEANMLTGEIDAAFTTVKAGARRDFNRLTLIGHGAFAFQRGTIVFEGTFLGGDRLIHLAVLGGTEGYEGARGSVTIRKTKTGSADAIHLLP